MSINLETVADFSWTFGHHFLLATLDKELYVWSDPDYGGDNTIRKLDIKKYPSSTDEWTRLYKKHFGTPFVRCKGRHTVKGYCGENVVFIRG